MPTIEVTDEQAMDLARGESITLAPAAQHRYVVLMTDDKDAYSVASTQELPEGEGTVDVEGTCVLIATDSHVLDKRPGDVRNSLSGPGYIMKMTA